MDGKNNKSWRDFAEPNLGYEISKTTSKKSAVCDHLTLDGKDAFVDTANGIVQVCPICRARRIKPERMLKDMCTHVYCDGKSAFIDEYVDGIPTIYQHCRICGTMRINPNHFYDYDSVEPSGDTPNQNPEFKLNKGNDKAVSYLIIPDLGHPDSEFTVVKTNVVVEHEFFTGFKSREEAQNFINKEN